MEKQPKTVTKWSPCWYKVSLCMYVLTQLVGVFHLFSKLVILLSLILDARRSANRAGRDVTCGRSNCTLFKLHSYFSHSYMVQLYCTTGFAWCTHSFVLPAVSLPLAPLASDWAFTVFFSFFWVLSFFWSDMAASVISKHLKYKQNNGSIKGHWKCSSPCLGDTKS